ncbi:MAG: hypothetical protein IKE41_01905 [Clostridia bacterium]|nr:hypothetical protein [Clostridia bacterium]
MSREDRLLNYVKNKNPYLTNPYIYKYKDTKGVTVKEVEEVLGSTECRKMISTLRDRGYRIVDVWEEGENKFGEPTRYKRYFIQGKKE